MTWEHFRRLEPVPPYTDVQRGFAAEVADPLWLLGRQWQVGEHAGEDASSPVLVEMQVAHTPLGAVAGLDPTVVPAEALLEGATDDWWTIGRRIRVGRAITAGLTPQERAAAAFGALPAPYGDALVGEVDGLAAHRLGLVPPGDPALDGFTPRPDFWQAQTLTYEAEVPVGGTTLTVSGHDGGDVDWYTADAPAPLPAPEFAVRQVIPSRLQYPGAPAPRWWQIEDSAVDIGGFPPDRAHLATALLIELVTDHANDWFTVPVPSPAPLAPGETAPPSSGVVVTLAGLRVKDGFDDWWDLSIPPGDEDPPAGPDEAAGPWSLFRTRGLDRSSLVVWPAATTPLSGPALDDVLLGIDEDANVMWAVELRADGIDLALSADATAALLETRRTQTRRFSYEPSTTLPEHWHPYRIENRPAPSGRMFVQGLVADLSQSPPVPRAAARSELIGAGAGHELAASAVPNQGLRLERRFSLARGTDGRPVLWRQRRRIPLLSGPVSHLRFDLLREGEPE
ncbi:hypothetical protein [Pengzhenrongella frigida]|uniref:Uncharacterized protein n=1 Tax=Pengzhenrongella frigida TaxID=1259133 RepID=A0A4Q5MX70_9MICO|nr:hypothetical protein [Cellulomonas sp. HLT2-17]RYV49533.1 hypothetical protein EUA98_18325 [Cellulomonas sp. HLT2-17]